METKGTSAYIAQISLKLLAVIFFSPSESWRLLSAKRFTVIKTDEELEKKWTH